MVAGVDGCRGGWVVATAWTDPLEIASIRFEPDLHGLFDLVARADVARVAIDMCVGLADSEPRSCDIEARSLLGPRRASVFPSPIRAALGCGSHAEASAVSRMRSGRGMSIQTWNIVPKIIELDGLISVDLQGRVNEAHPEVAFARLNGSPGQHHKATPAGRAERLAIVGPVPEIHRRTARFDDVIDALILVRTAADWFAGDSWRLGDGTRDARGLEMLIRG